MANRNRNRPPQSERGRQPQQHDWERDPYRQQEQYQRGMDEQQGENRSGYRDDYRQPRQYDRGEDRGAFSESRYGDPSTSYSQQRDYDPLGDYDRASYSVRQDEYGPDRATHSYFRADDFGGEDYSADISRGYGTRPSRMSGYAAGRSGGGGYGGDTGRGFFDRMGDEVSSWFGDEEAARRRRMDHRGSGPANYKRSDERLLEDACERLTHDRWVDAKNINVTVSDNEVTLDGTVESRQAKRRAEDCIDEITGVKHVQNNLRVVETDSKYEAMNNRADES